MSGLFLIDLALLSLSSFEQKSKRPKLALASTYDFNNNAVRTRSNQGSYMANDLGFFETNIKTHSFFPEDVVQGF